METPQLTDTQKSWSVERIRFGGLVRVIIGGLALLIWLSLTSSAIAGPPTHSPLPALDLGGFNHACGVATDTEGDLYVASAGESKVRVFDTEHDELTSISNSNKPCGLAVDSKGNVYVLENATGSVVRYAPSDYPFVGTPTYGPPGTIDASGVATGISIDAISGDLYVAKGDRIDVYDENGAYYGPVDEVQRVLPYNATGGAF